MNTKKTKQLMIFIALFICLNISIWFFYSILEGTAVVYLWQKEIKVLYSFTVLFSFLVSLIATNYLTNEN